MLHLDVLNPTFVQGDHSGQGLGFVDFTSVVLPSAQFCFVDKMCTVVSDHHGYPVPLYTIALMGYSSRLRSTVEPVCKVFSDARSIFSWSQSESAISLY